MTTPKATSSHDQDAQFRAITILEKLLNRHIPLSSLLVSTPSAPMPAMTRALCFGVARYYFQLEAIADSLLKKRPKDQALWCIILLGLYQLYERTNPDHSIVNNSVTLTIRIKKAWAKGMVNAVLRTFCRQRDTLLNELGQQSLTAAYNHPAWLIERLRQAWPDVWEKILHENDQHPPMTLRVNATASNAQQARDSYLQTLHEAGITAIASNYAPQAITLEKPCDVQQLPEFNRGAVSVQDGAAQLAAPLLALAPQLRVLDACCAPGGKTAHILEIEPRLKALLALDIDSERLTRVKDNLLRLNLHLKIKDQYTLSINGTQENSIIKVQQGDAAKPEAWWDETQFDRILLDAPCTATGVIRRHPDIKYLRTPNDVKQICDTQSNLLKRLWPLLTPGGRLVYATCSILPEENHAQIKQFLSAHTDATCMPLDAHWGHTTEYGTQILPGEHGMDGFFYAILIKAQ